VGTKRDPTFSLRATVGASFEEAITVAREIGSRLIELRATTSHTRLLRDPGRSAEARALLAPIYAVFTEGFDTADLVAAKALLVELACARRV
jgi:predicted ATPase